MRAATVALFIVDVLVVVIDSSSCSSGKWRESARRHRPPAHGPVVKLATGPGLPRAHGCRSRSLRPQPPPQRPCAPQQQGHRRLARHCEQLGQLRSRRSRRRIISAQQQPLRRPRGSARAVGLTSVSGNIDRTACTRQPRSLAQGSRREACRAVGASRMQNISKRRGLGRGFRHSPCACGCVAAHPASPRQV